MILLLMLNANIASTTCVPGCVSCKNKDNCLISDVLQFFMISNGLPKKVYLEDCVLINLEGECVKCSKDHVLDPATKRCYKLTEENRIAGCEIYFQQSICMSCDKDHYIAHTCHSLSKTVDNCMYYVWDGVCGSCKYGYLLSLETNKCKAIKNKDHCQSFSNYDCKFCSAGFVMKKNKFLNKAIAKYISLTDYYLSLISSTKEVNFNGLQVLDVCVESKDLNCDIWDDEAEECLVCKYGYFLNSNKQGCVAFPREITINCKDYGSGGVCVRCESGYLLDEKKCYKMSSDQAILNCDLYDGSFNRPVAFKCKNGYFVEDNECSERKDSLSIENCLRVNDFADECGECNEGFILTDQGRVCLPGIDQCKSYEYKANSKELTCSDCNKGFYLELKEGKIACQPIPIDNCSSYDKETKKCKSCFNSYVIKDGDCKKSNEIENCGKYDEFEKNICRECVEGPFINFKVKKTCKRIDCFIDHCEIVELTTEGKCVCSKCELGYNWESDLCKSIETENCLKKADSGECVICKAGYALSNDKQSCAGLPKVFSNNCASDNLDHSTNEIQIKDAYCESCAVMSFPHNINNTFVCLSSEELKNRNRGMDFIDECIRYDEQFNCVQCNPESINQFLITTEGSSFCSDTCNTFSLLTITNNNFLTWNSCLSVSEGDDCRVYGPDLTDLSFKQICLKCHQTAITVVDLEDSSYSIVSLREGSEFPYIDSAKDRHSLVDCLKLDDVTVFGEEESIDTSVIGCESFAKRGLAYVCVKCKTGYSGVALANGHIKGCSEDKEANSTIQLSNLNLLWTKLFSFHSCKNSSIPFIAYESVSVNDPSFKQFSPFKAVLSNSVFQVANGDDKTVFCASNSKDEFNIKKDYGVDKNCALGVLLVNSNGESDFDDNRFGTFCAACKPGYKPKAHSQYGFVIEQCQKIDFCDETGLMANGCEKCNSNSIHEYKDGQIDFTVCISLPTQILNEFKNCEAVSEDKSIFQCEVCKKGIFKNADGVCDPISPYNCSLGSLNKFEIKDHKTADWALYHRYTDGGCFLCKEGHSGLLMKDSKQICLYSDYYINNIHRSSIALKTKYISYCQNYKVGKNDELLCEKCREGYVIKGNKDTGVYGDDCFANKFLLWCEVAKTNYWCIECQKYSADFGGYCYLGKTPHCEKYVIYDIILGIHCSECENGYVLNANQECDKSEIQNCEIYSQTDISKCELCKEGFIKIKTKDDIDYCFPLESNLNCKNAVFSYSNDMNMIECVSCLNDKMFVLEEIDENIGNTMCLGYNEISNCLIYEKEDDLANMCFGCIECQDTHYADKTTKRCVERKNKDPNCIEQTIDEDTCNECGERTFLSNDKTRCVDYPFGMFGCRDYTDKDSCSFCKPGFYLDNKVCKEVVDKIAHCEHYTWNGVCGACKHQYILSSNSCEKSKAKDCLKYFSKTACETCPPLYVFETVDNIISCVPMDKPNCLKIHPYSPFYCLKCENGYYLDEGDCHKPLPPINHCLIYKSNNECLRCEDGYPLSLDHKKCSNHYVNSQDIPLNCADIQEQQEPVCSECKAQYIFENGQCTRHCKGDKNKDCFSCDTNDRHTCLVCNSGFYLVDGICQSISHCDVTNCKLCDSNNNGLCKECRFGYYLKNNECMEICSPNADDHCIDCDPVNRDACKTCASNYELINNKCFPKCNDPNRPNCRFCESFSPICLDCKENFFVEDGVCKNYCTGPGKDNCLACDKNSTEICLFCESGFLLEDNSCLEACKDEQQFNCLLCDKERENECFRCRDSYVLTKGRCEPEKLCKASNCLSCQKNSTKKCEICKDDYESTTEGVCELVTEPIKGDVEISQTEDTETEFEIGEEPIDKVSANNRILSLFSTLLISLLYLKVH